MRIKKILSFITITTLLLISATTSVIADENIIVKLDGQQIVFDIQPQLINDRTMVPLRAIFEVLGATVDWNDSTQTVTSTKGDTTISLTINSPTMYVNGTAVTLDSPACLVGGRTLVPVRAISEAFGTRVDWDGTSNTVSIKTDGYVETLSYNEAFTLAKEKVTVTLIIPSVGASDNSYVTVKYVNHSGYDIKLSSFATANGKLCYNSSAGDHILPSGYSVAINYLRDMVSTKMYSTKDIYLDNNSTAYTTFELGGNKMFIKFGVNGVVQYGTSLADIGVY